MLRHLNMMRMVCDTNYILNPEHRACPKLAELEKILEECRENPETKVIVFSEWQRMLELIRGHQRRVTIELAEADVERAQRLARERGLDYKTYIRTLLHEAIDREAGGQGAA